MHIIPREQIKMNETPINLPQNNADNIVNIKTDIKEIKDSAIVHEDERLKLQSDLQKRDVDQQKRDVIQVTRSENVNETMEAVHRIEIILAGTIESPGGFIRDVTENIKNLNHDINGDGVPGLIERMKNNETAIIAMEKEINTLKTRGSDEIPEINARILKTEQEINAIQTQHDDEKILKDARINIRSSIWEFTKDAVPIIVGIIGAIYGLLSNQSVHDYIKNLFK